MTKGKTAKKSSTVVKLRKVTKNRFLGYCPSCDCMLAMNDRESIQIVICQRCGYRGRIGTLLTQAEKTAADNYEPDDSEFLTTEIVDDDLVVIETVLDDSNDHEERMEQI